MLSYRACACAINFVELDTGAATAGNTAELATGAGGFEVTIVTTGVIIAFVVEVPEISTGDKIKRKIPR
jgi:hypothetical protein